MFSISDHVRRIVTRLADNCRPVLIHLLLSLSLLLAVVVVVVVILVLET